MKKLTLVLILIIAITSYGQDDSFYVKEEPPKPLKFITDVAYSNVSPIINREVRIRIETLMGYNLVNDNEINIINSGIVTMQRTGDYRVSIRDMGSDLIDVTIKLDAIRLTKLLECANSQ